MNTVPMNTEADILARVIAPEAPTLPADTAKMLLTFDFSKEDQARMNQLAEKAREGTLTAAEQAEIDCYERVGHFLSLLRAKARISLKSADTHA
jgi:uncharacterized protein YnzC (UPF0291/DUF896 family)